MTVPAATTPAHDARMVAQGVASVLGSTFIWGFGFVATKWSLTAMGPHWFNACRFLIAVAVGVAVTALVPALRPVTWRREMALAFKPGVLLTGLFVFQTFGLTLTSVANSSFITTLYVVFVPLFQLLIQRARPTAGHSWLVALSLVGTALICGVDDFGALNLGDLSTLLCAMCGGLHFLVIEKRAPLITRPFAFNICQHAWAAVIGVAIACLAEAPPALSPAAGLKPWFGLLFLAVPSSLVAFYLQIRAQKYIPAGLASLLCLLESPIATASGFLFMGETVDPGQAAGAVLIVTAAVIAVRLAPPAPPEALV